jgi:hypothetical protein
MDKELLIKYAVSVFGVNREKAEDYFTNTPFNIPLLDFLKKYDNFKDKIDRYALKKGALSSEIWRIIGMEDGKLTSGDIFERLKIGLDFDLAREDFELVLDAMEKSSRRYIKKKEDGKYENVYSDWI